MYYHRLIISYKGSHYYGSQDLGNKEAKPTIETSMHQVLKKICKYKDCTIAAASRTDAGVHAQGQVLKITIPSAIDSEKLMLGLNSLLPEDIRVLQCTPSTSAFNPNKNSTSKEYHYYFSTDTVYNPMCNDIVAHVPSSDTSLLDMVRMKEACRLFIGTHDFYSFAKRDTTMHSTFRTIVSCELLQAPVTFGQEVYYFKIVGEGFLRYMVRYLVGALLMIGRKEISLNDISKALVTPTEKKLSPKAKAKGLHLIQICY